MRQARAARHWLRLHLFKQAWLAEGFSDPEAQEEMLLDTVRCDAYRQAIRRTVKPGDVVVDMGAGTGLLSFFALQAGARHVYAIEMGQIAGLASELIATNGFESRVTLIPESSTKAKLPELCDVLVTETLSSFGFDDENIVAYVADARRRFLKPGACIIPEQCDALVMPYSSDAFGPGQFPRTLYDLDYRPFRQRRFGGMITVATGNKTYRALGAPQSFARIDFYEAEKDPGPAAVTLPITADGRLDGFLGWFHSRLCEGVTLSNAPDLPATHWLQMLFPVPDQPQVRAGDTAILHLDPHMVAGGAQWEYRVELV